MWNRRRNAERLPWYRAHTFKGNLTEAEKRKLDAFRTQPTHPAALFADLPGEVQAYINRIEFELNNEKQDRLTGRTFAWSLAGAALLYLNYFGHPTTPPTWSYVTGALILVGPWFVWIYEGKKIRKQFFPSEPGLPYGTDEAIRTEWELNYLTSVLRPLEREGTSDPK